MSTMVIWERKKEKKKKASTTTLSLAIESINEYFLSGAQGIGRWVVVGCCLMMFLINNYCSLNRATVPFHISQAISISISRYSTRWRADHYPYYCNATSTIKNILHNRLVSPSHPEGVIALDKSGSRCESRYRIPWAPSWTRGKIAERP